ncbi:MAG: hypothetical protein QM817_30555 [Archangium sp.]
MWLTLAVSLFTAQVREVPLTKFNQLADARVIHAVATSQNGHTVSVWTRWSESAPCLGWSFDDEGEKPEGLGEVPCPAAPPRGKRHLFLDSKLLGAPKQLVPVLDAQRGLVALQFPHALGVARDEDGTMVGAWGLGDFTLRGLSVGEHDWLLWVQDAKGVDRLFFVDPAALTSGEFGDPAVETIPLMNVGFGWKKESTKQQVGPCTLERRGVMMDEQTLLLDWRASTSRIELRATSVNGEQKVWKLDAAGGTPVAGLDVQRVHFARDGVWRLHVRFPWPVSQLSLSETDKPARRLSPVVSAVGDSMCVMKDGVLRPSDFTLDPRWR